MQNCGALGMRMLDRNIKTWAEVSSDLRDDNYTADSMARDLAKVITTSMSTLDDAWRYATRPPAREQTARALPSAFLLFRELPEFPGHSLASPVYIDIPFEVTKGQVPEDVKIKLSRTAGESAAGVDALLARIIVRKVTNTDQYVLSAVNDQQKDDTGAGSELSAGSISEAKTTTIPEKMQLIPGLYDGLVYLETPPVALASLRVVVSGPVELSEPMPAVKINKGATVDVQNTTKSK
jgi:hypothetical protein